MDTKRQTIWLVSMLSLMVILSAYYLLTEDPTKNFDAANSEQDDHEITVDVTSTGIQDSDKLGSQLFPGLVDGLLADQLQNSGTQSIQTDAQILDQLLQQTQSSSTFFERALMQRSEDMSREYEQWNQIASDSAMSNEAVAEALTQIKHMTDMQTRITQLEEELNEQFPNVVVLKDGDEKWKVTVQANKLEKTQAVSIFDRAIEALDIGEEQISLDIFP